MNQVKDAGRLQFANMCYINSHKEREVKKKKQILNKKNKYVSSQMKIIISSLYQLRIWLEK